MFVVVGGVSKSDGGSGDAIKDAVTSTLDRLLATCPHTYAKVHGNANQMTETKKGKTSVRTAHSLNPVPFIIYDKDR